MVVTATNELDNILALDGTADEEELPNVSKKEMV